MTWLLLKPGRSIRPRAERDKPVERWVPTGLHEFFPHDRVTEEQYLDQRLAQLGLGPEQLDHVVFSHLHLDHAGNAKMFQDTGPRLVVNDLSHRSPDGHHT